MAHDVILTPSESGVHVFSSRLTYSEDVEEPCFCSLRAIEIKYVTH